MPKYTGPVSIIWNDVDRTTTKHDFASPKDPELEKWLANVLQYSFWEDYHDWLQGNGISNDGVARLLYYDHIDDQTLGDFEVFFGGMEESILSLFDAYESPE